MLGLFKKLWNDEAGAIISTEIVCVSTILVIGVVSGLTAVRDAIVTELDDVAHAIGSMNQSYTVDGSQSFSSATASFGYIDGKDFDELGVNPSPRRCVIVGFVDLGSE